MNQKVLNIAPNFSSFALLISALVLSLMISGLINGQSAEDALAKVGNTVITAEEFIRRYEFTPHPKLNNDNSFSDKLSFLLTLIPEKAWYEEAIRQSVDTIQIIRESIKFLEKKLVRDALYKNEILNKVIISEEEINEGLRRNEIKLEVKYLYSANEEEIENIYELLQDGLPFDTILTSRPEIKMQEESQFVEYGEAVQEVEDEIFSLDPGEFTRPLHVKNGWNIFYLVNRYVNNRFESEQDSYNFVRKVIKNHKANSLFRQYWTSYFSEHNVGVSEKKFDLLFTNLRNLIDRKQGSDNSVNSENIYITGEDAYTLETTIDAASLNKPFILFSDKPITLKKFIREFFLDRKNFNANDTIDLRNLLHVELENYIRLEMLAREGYRQGLQSGNFVKETIAMWRHNSFFKYMKAIYLNDADSLSKIGNEKSFDSELEDNSSDNSFALKTAELVGSYPLEINMKLLEEIPVTDINSFGIIKLGFGGTIPAVPLLQPFIEWSRFCSEINFPLP